MELVDVILGSKEGKEQRDVSRAAKRDGNEAREEGNPKPILAGDHIAFGAHAFCLLSSKKACYL